MIKQLRIVNGYVLVALLVCVTAVGVHTTYAAVTYTKPVSVSNVLNEVIAEDDWFAEIDDMIEEMAVPASPGVTDSGQQDVQFETNRVTRSVEKKRIPPEKRAEQPAKRFVKAGAEPQDTTETQAENQDVTQFDAESAFNAFPEEPEIDFTQDEQSIFADQTDSSSPNPVSSSIIQEILRSDYWLEEEASEKTAPAVVPAATVAAESEEPDEAELEKIVYTASPIEKMTVEEKQSAEEQLLSLERELLHDLNVDPPVDALPPTESGDAAGVSIVEADLMERTEQADQAEVEQPKVSEGLEDELLAELDSFIEQEAAPEAAVEEVTQSVETPEQKALDASLAKVEMETVAEPSDATKVDAVLEIAENQEPIAEEKVKAPSPLQDAGIEELNEQLNNAIADGDREEILRISSALAQRVETLPQDTQKDVPQKVQPEQKTFAKKQEPPVEKTYETQQAMPLADPDRHIKRFARADIPEEKTPMRKAVLAETTVTDAAQPTRPAAAKKFAKQQVMVMNPSANRTPLKESDDTVQKTEANAATPKSITARVPEMRAFPKVDTSVFLRSSPASEMRVQERTKPVQDDGSKNVRVVVPGTQTDPNSLDAPVPFEW